MKKILASVCVLALPALASAQVELVSGFNFGQFIGTGAPTLNGETFETSPSIGANYKGLLTPPAASGGGFVGNNGLTGDFQIAGGGRAYWDGSFGSTAYDFTNGVEIVAGSTGPNSVGGALVTGGQMWALGDDLGLALQNNLAGGRVAFVMDTTGYSDYSPAGLLDANFRFAASVSAPVTINWYLNGSATSFASTALAGTTLTAYTVDLPAEFYGLSSAQLVAEFSGSALIDNVQINGLTAIPEPSTYAAILGLATLGFVALRRRNQAAAAV